MTYNLSSAPQWISLDSNTRTLSGTPLASDVGADPVTGVGISLTASDQTGSVTLNATIVVSKNSGPEVTDPLSAQLPSLGAFSLPSTLLYHPSEAFKLNLDRGTFSVSDGSSNFSYYAVTDDNTPLPSWISFDSTSFTFSGQTPDYASLIQPPQTFGFKLIASDVEGFAGASVSFDIEVGVHLFAFKDANMILNATLGSETTFTALSNNLQLDGQVANMSSIASITAKSPPWLSFNNATLELSGTAPPDAIPENVTIQATDIYGDTASATISIDIPGAIFSTDVASFNATIGAPFSHDLSTYVRNKSDIDMTVQFSPSISWATFNPQTFILSGYVPTNPRLSVINVTIEATSKSPQASSTQSFRLFLVSAESVPTDGFRPTTRTTSTTGTGRVTTTSAPDMAATHRGLSKSTIAAIVVPVILALLLIITLIAFLCHRKNRSTEPKDYLTAPNLGVSRPSTPNMIEIAVPTPPPQPLQLDTTGFAGIDNRSSVYSDHKSISTNADKSIKRSQTVTGVSGALMARTKRPDTAGTSGTRSRAYSENTLSMPSTPNWRLAQDGSYPTLGARSRANSVVSARVARTYSNYSRKGHTRRTGQIWPADPALRDSLASNPEPAILLSLKDSNFSTVPSDRLSNIPKRGSVLEIPKSDIDIERIAAVSKSKRRVSKQKVTSPLDRTRTGIGHGNRESIDSVTSSSPKRRSIGHGQLQEWSTGPSLSRDSKTWVTVEMRDDDVSSNITDPSDIKHAYEVAEAATKQLNAPALETTTIRPISRRIIGESPFFSGGSLSEAPTKKPSFRASRLSHLAAESEAAIEGPASPDLKSQYGSTHESTRQLRSYGQCQSRSQRVGSIRSNESRDSRFESASPSLQSMSQSHGIRDTEDVEMRDAGGDDAEWQDFLPDDISSGSWETSHSPERNSQPNVRDYEQTEKPNQVLGPLVNMELGANARIHASRGKRPVSVDNAKIDSVRGKVERDNSVTSWTAYV
jgi:axial budding pattern protein 2